MTTFNLSALRDVAPCEAWAWQTIAHSDLTAVEALVLAAFGRCADEALHTGSGYTSTTAGWVRTRLPGTLALEAVAAAVTVLVSRDLLVLAYQPLPDQEHLRGYRIPEEAFA